MPSTIVIPPADTAKPHSSQSSYEKGWLFEKFIKELFNEKSFELIKWREAKKYHDDSIPGDHCYPDLEIMFGKYRKYKFAVECKWKQNFGKGEYITWATKSQIEKYKEFENYRRIQVFVAIGIGGAPDNPEKLFVTPLCNIETKRRIKESDLLVYKRKPTHRFFYDTCQYKLF
jgi:hypothetical protein